jgi:hypothetical protein
MDIFILLGAILPLVIADQFTYPPTYGAAGEYYSNLQFTTGQRITLTWDATTSDSSLGIWLMQDQVNPPLQCIFQSNALCAQIAG